METNLIPIAGDIGELVNLGLGCLPLDLYQNILGFLSTKDKITIRKVSRIFKENVNPRIMIIYRLSNKLPKIYSIEKKWSQDLILTINNNFIMYTEEKKGVHPLFRIDNHKYDRCIDAYCREKKIGNIYLSYKSEIISYNLTSVPNLYQKRIIPYCLNCFNKWGLDILSNYGVN